MNQILPLLGLKLPRADDFRGLKGSKIRPRVRSWMVWVAELRSLFISLVGSASWGEYDDAWFQQNLMRIDLAFRHMFEVRNIGSIGFGTFCAKISNTNVAIWWFFVDVWIVWWFLMIQMGVSKNRGTPKSSILIGVFHYKPSILGYPCFWKHPNQTETCV